MAESYVAVTPSGSTKLHYFERTIGANTVQQQVKLNGEAYSATYTITSAAISIATADAHLLEIMAGASLPVYLRSLRVYQVALATTEAIATWELWRLSTAGTGGTALTPALMDTTDSASGATAMTLATAKGTESTKWWSGTSQLTDTLSTQGNGQNTTLLDLRWDELLRSKTPRLAAGATNGFALKWVSASAGATAIVVATISELTV